MTNRFDGLTFDKFRDLATEDGLSRHERVGFPDSYREGKETEIFADVTGKLAALARPGARVLEIGPGCSDLPRMLIEHCAARSQQLYFVDSAEMLQLLPDAPGVTKWPGRYPDDVKASLEGVRGRLDAILAYSVVQYVFAEGNLWDFVDRSLALLAEGGELLLGDVPNISMRKRFFASEAGLRSHQAYTGGTEPPQVTFNNLEPGQMDDSVVLALLARARAQGFHAWVMPQRAALPMANRREDILIRRP